LRLLQALPSREHSNAVRRYFHVEDEDICSHVVGESVSWPQLPIEDFAPLRQTELPQLLEAGFGDIVERMESLSKEMEALQDRLTQLEQALASQPRCRQALLYDLGGEKYQLRQPLAVQLEEYEEEAVARVPELDVFASADTDSEALALLKREVETLYEELAATPIEQLGERPRAWLRLLERVIQVAESP
jgi:hypothetical protein